MATWSGELHGWRALADFTKPPPNELDWIPDPETKITHRGRRESRRIRNDMDASEARGAEKYCLACGGEHLRKDCECYPTIRVYTARRKGVFHNATLRRSRKKAVYILCVTFITCNHDVLYAFELCVCVHVRTMCCMVGLYAFELCACVRVRTKFYVPCYCSNLP